VEAVLARRVPDLQLHPRVGYCDDLHLEVDADCRQVVHTVLVAHEPQQEASLADPRVSYQQYFR